MSTLLTMPRYGYIAPFALDGMALAFPALAEAFHPNRVPWSGILTRLDEPSTRVPHGAHRPGDAQGHRVLIPSAVADAALSSLMGMPVNYAASFRDHDKQHPIGAIHEAHIAGKDLCVSGYLYGKNFEEAVRYIQANTGLLGMSFELADCEVLDANAEVWTLTHFVFTGAAILRRDAAAYERTAIAAAAEGEAMEDELMKKLTAVQAQLQVMAAHESDDEAVSAAEEEADAATADAEASRAMSAAARAEADADAEDAAGHRAIAAAKFQAASQKRACAIRRHEVLAGHYADAGETEAAARHQADALRLQADEAASVATRRALDATDAPAAPPEDDTDEDDMQRLFGAYQKFKAYCQQNGMTARGPAARREPRATVEHPDEDEDIALFRKLMQLKEPSGSAGGDVTARRQLRKMEASLELLTDTVTQIATQLATDRAAGRRDLATDGHEGAAGGPVRRSMHATTEAWVSKDRPPEGSTSKQTPAEIHAAATAAGKSLRASMQDELEARWKNTV